MSTWREAYRALQRDGSEGCSDEASLAALARGELDVATRDELADHVLVCRRCSERYRCLVRGDRCPDGPTEARDDD